MVVARIVVLTSIALGAVGLAVGQLPRERSQYLSGRVQDAETGLEVTQALVRLEGRNFRLRTFTDHAGYFRFRELEADFYTVEVTCQGYSPAREQFDLTSQSITDAVIRLRPAAPVEVAPPSDVLSVSQLAIPKEAQDAFHQGFNELHGNSDPKLSVPHFRKAIELYPDYDDAYIQLGVAHYELSQFDQAQEALQKAVEVSPENARAHGTLGMVLMKQGQVSGAIRAYERAVELDDSLWQAHFELARLFLEQGKIEAAHKHAQRAHELNTEYPDVHLVYYKMCIAREDYKAALVEIDEIIEKFSDNPRFANLKEVREKLRRAVEGQPK